MIPLRSQHPATVVDNAVDLSGWSRFGAVAVTFVAAILTLIITQPLILRPASAIYADITGDAVGTVSVFWWWSYAIHHGLGLFQNTFLGAPIGSGWDRVPFTVVHVALFGPLSALIGPVLAYNLGILISFPATALVTYLLGRRLGLTALAAGFTALAFAFLPWHVEKAMGHLGQAHLELFPGLLLFLVRWWQGGSRWNLVAAGAIAGLTLWTDFNFPFILAVLILAFFAVSLFVPMRPLSLRTRLLDHARALGAMAASAVVFLPAAVLVADRPGSGSYVQTLQNFSGAQRALVDLQSYSARPLEFLLPWHANPLLPEWFRAYEVSNLHFSNFTENSLSIGYTVLILGLIGLSLYRSQFFVITLAVTLAFAGVILSLPPHMNIFGFHTIGPSDVIYRFVPFIRVYARFGLLTLFGTALIAGFGFMRFEQWIRARRLRWLAFAPFLLLAVEFNNQPPSHVLQLLPAPAEYQWLRNQPAGILAEYPLAAGNPGTEEVQTHEYMFYLQVHEHPILNTDVVPSPAHDVAAQLEPYFAPGVAARLQRLGIRYVFVHRRQYAADGYAVPTAVQGLQLVASFGDTDVFTVSQ